MGEATDAYLKGYIDAATMLGAEMDRRSRGLPFRFARRPPHGSRAPAVAPRRRLGSEAAHTRLLLENLNKEPPDAEVHYLAHTLEEWR